MLTYVSFCVIIRKSKGKKVCKIFCSKCGAEIKEDLNFCTNCGKMIGFGLTEEKVQASSSNQASQEH
ncbi:MAG: zinc ribbon domain-containing protein, partial [Ruminiclostridium sp.]|nr:zinc ribbon domain-containing protein [Ruminiclostridium sp.]